MASPSKSTSSRAKVAAPRARVRVQGLGPIRIWVPDVRSPEFKAEAERQSRLVAMDRHEAKTMAFIATAADGGGEG